MMQARFDAMMRAITAALPEGDARRVESVQRLTALSDGAQAEAARLDAVRARGMVPPECGDAIPVAPARGAVRVFDFMESYPKGPDGSELKPAGFMGRRTMARMDAFDRMAAHARRAGAVGELTVSQVGIGRMYRTMVEDRNAGAMRGVSVETMMTGGAGRGTREGFTDHRLDLSRRIDQLQARIGQGVAMMPVRSSRASVITARALVDAVCLDDRDLKAVLRSYGWSGKGDVIAQARQALADALERMIGPRRPSRIVVIRPEGLC